jgi:hypothetical protein
MTNKHTEVFLGHPPSDPTEKKFLRQLSRDLVQCGVDALVLANIEVGPGRRQLDFLIVTAARTVQCELKGLRLPVIGTANGLWHQVAPGGERRVLDTNPGRQAKEITFALSDEMKAFARKVTVPRPPKGHFYRAIDTVVCVFPEIPHGSQIDRHPHVTVLGYEDLLARVGADGPRIPWTREHWGAFIRHLGLYRPEDQQREARQARQRRELAEDYARRFARTHGHALEPIVQTEARVAGVEIEQMNLAARLLAGETVRVIGPSGVGKTLRSRAAAVELAERGEIPIWLDAADWDPRLDAFETLLGRAVGSFTTGSASELISSATASGRRVAVILDGLNECPPASRGELLSAVGGLALNHEAGVLISSSAEVVLPETLSPHEAIELLLPDRDDKEQILAAHHAEDLVPHSDTFQTPFELVIAARCFQEIPGPPTRATVLDAYVGQLAGSESARAVLRSLAGEMHRGLRGSLPVQETLRRLQRDGVTAQEIDVALASPLLRVTQGRLSFTHESLVRFLAAEVLLIETPDVEALGVALAEPANAELRADVLALEDEDRATELLAALGDERVLIAAMTGGLGDAAQKAIERMIGSLLSRAKALTATATIDDPASGGMGGPAWDTGYAWSAAELAILSALGRAIHCGFLLPAVIDLFSETDARCEAILDRYGRSDSEKAISAIVASAYIIGVDNSNTLLPASAIFRGCGSEWGLRDRDPRAGDVAARLVQTADERSWGLLLIAMKLFHRCAGSYSEAVPELLRKAWAARAFHLRLEVGHLAHDIAWRVDDQVREEIKKTLLELESDNLAVGSFLLEALDAYGLVEGRPQDDVEREIAAVLAMPDSHPQADERARSAISSMFDPEGIVGSYSQAIEELETPERTKLFLRATRATDADDLCMDVALRELQRIGDLSDPAVQAPFVRMLRTPKPGDWHSPQFGMRSCLIAVEVCATFASAPLPPATDIPGMEGWRVMFALLFWMEHDSLHQADGVEAVNELLAELRSPAVRAGAVGVLQLMRSSDPWRGPDDVASPYQRLLEQHSGKIAELMRWALEHEHELTSPVRWHDDSTRGYIVATLGDLGDDRDLAALRSLANDGGLSSAVREAVRQIEARQTVSS